MRVERCEEPGPEWDEFVVAQRGGTLAHASAWKRVLEEGYRLETCFLTARTSEGSLRGILPMARVPALRGSYTWVSLPYLDTGGILAADVEAERALVEEALRHVRSRRAAGLELRQLEPGRSLPAPSAQDRVDLVLDLDEDEEAQWRALPAKVRNQTRKATRSGLQLAPAEGSLLDAFYAPFCVNMRDLGSPVHGRPFFAAMARAFGPSLRFVVVRDEERPVGGLVAIHFGDTVTVPWASTLRSERSRCPNNLIYWEALRWALERGARRFDFGRSPREAGTFRFKKGWGARERPLAWVHLAPGGTSLPVSHPGESPLLRWASELWPRLPLWLTARVGPVIRRRLAS